jgi:glutathione synthase/RimK-type ligase-like ATP-grasp enzyme
VALRFGSSKPHNTDGMLLLNSVEGIKISSDKRLSKKAMVECNIHTADYINTSDVALIRTFYNVHAPLIVKKYNSCKGNDIYYIDTPEALETFLQEHNDLNKYVFEKYFDYKREYRFHVDVNHGIFYGCRKLLKNDAEETWHRHDCNSVWILPNNPKFKKPAFIKNIEEDCIKYMKHVGLDICAFDVKSDDNSFIILESNTAPSLGEYGLSIYKNHFYKYYNESIQR